LYSSVDPNYLDVIISVVKTPDFSFEKRLWKKELSVVAGVDEVGRGSFAGPVVAGCVVFSNNLTIKQLNNEAIKINDSKKLTSKQREKSAEWIKKNALSWGIGIGTVSKINKKGMTKATNSAFRRAISKVNEKLKVRVDYLLIDAFYIPYVRGLRVGKKNGLKQRKDPVALLNRSRQLAIIDGDEKSFSIAAASIIAKVYRDRLMEELGKKRQYLKYDFVHNKGYGTKAHQEAIKKYGISRLHRTKFVETFLKA